MNPAARRYLKAVQEVRALAVTVLSLDDKRFATLASDVRVRLTAELAESSTKLQQQLAEARAMQRARPRDSFLARVVREYEQAIREVTECRQRLETSEV